MGRDHLGNHHCTVIIGKSMRSSVIRRRRPSAATMPPPRSTRSGKPGVSADIRFEETLGAVERITGAAVGVSEEVLNERGSPTGKIVRPTSSSRPLPRRDAQNPPSIPHPLPRISHRRGRDRLCYPREIPVRPAAAERPAASGPGGLLVTCSESTPAGKRRARA